MFQNLNEDTIELNKNKDKFKNVNIFANIFAKENIVLYIIAFMLSQVGIGGEFSIFSISLLGACFASSVPAIGIIVVSLIGNFIKFGIGGALGYLLTTLVLVASLFILKPLYNDKERNEKIKIAKNVFVATLIIQIIKLGMAQFTVYDALMGVTISIIAFVFYKIFVNSIVVLQEFNREKAFSIEEVIGASLLLAIAVGCFGDLALFGFNIKNILSILIVLVLGWKNGILIGTTVGVTIGITLGVITGSEPIMIAAYAISGMIAGILNRFGKIGVAVGFALGNVVLAYVSNGYTVELIHFKEILIASIGLFAIPKTINIDIEEFIGNSKFLPVVPNRSLNKSKQMIENLDNVSETIQEMAKTYKKTETISFEENTQRNTNKQIFITELLFNLEPYKDNMLYDDISKTDGQIIEEIFNTLIEKQEIDKQDLLEIFAKCNSYIIGFDDKDISVYLEENIAQIVRTINMSYKISKSDFVWKKKLEEKDKAVEKQLSGVSKAINKMARNIEDTLDKEIQYSKEQAEITELLKQKGLEIEEISISKDNRFIIDIYTSEIFETAKIYKIEKILTKVLKEKIVINENITVGKRLNFLSEDKYEMAIGVAEASKLKTQESGDSVLKIRLKDGKYLVAISDGMGTGKEAKQSSTKALKMLENLLISGFDKATSMELINSTLLSKDNEIFATLDVAIIDLYAGVIEFIKSGACPTYIKNNKKVQIIKSNSLPTGIINQENSQGFDKDIQAGDIILMCTDGILESNIEYKNKELWIKYMLEDIETNNTKKIADLILREAEDNAFGVIKDDMSIVVCKFQEK